MLTKRTSGLVSSAMLRFAVILLVMLNVAACVGAGKPVRVQNPDRVQTRAQAIALVREYERELNRAMYGADNVSPLISDEEPYAVEETSDSFRIEYRKPFRPQGGGYNVGFSVNRKTAEVSRTAWTFGR